MSSFTGGVFWHCIIHDILDFEQTQTSCTLKHGNYQNPNHIIKLRNIHIHATPKTQLERDNHLV